MEAQELEKLQMDSLREIADSNYLVAGMKAELLKLEDRKKTFIAERDKEVLDRVRKLLADSQALLEETKSNYTLVHEFYNGLKVFSEFIKGAGENLTKGIAEFKTKSDEWENEVKKQEEIIFELRKDLRIDQQSLERDKEHLKKKTSELKKERDYLEKQQTEIQLKLKDLWNKNK